MDKVKAMRSVVLPDLRSAAERAYGEKPTGADLEQMYRSCEMSELHLGALSKVIKVEWSATGPSAKNSLVNLYRQDGKDTGGSMPGRDLGRIYCRAEERLIWCLAGRRARAMSGISACDLKTAGMRECLHSVCARGRKLPQRALRERTACPSRSLASGLTRAHFRAARIAGGWGYIHV